MHVQRNNVVIKVKEAFTKFSRDVAATLLVLMTQQRYIINPITKIDHDNGLKLIFTKHLYLIIKISEVLISEFIL